MTSILVRPITDADVPGAAAALVEVHTTDGYPVEGVEEPESWIRPPAVLGGWVAEEEGKIVGHVAVMRPRGEGAVRLWQDKSGETEERIGVLARLFVVREARRHAVGERMMQAAMDYARKNSLRLVLDVMTKDAAAIRLYERLGWQRIGEVAHHFGADQQSPAACYVWPAA
ncbi:Acetyltransferase (GNAT) family protein [Streptomyces sp. DvalAA-14]|uniref:GNAT family N-acetyltransferase n=1 Tax=unclassified Streptomyces TaxID=2593676 RepID=UPI00081B65DD|nr:GNAT family N-acetyltransferase [Streptomyces sp. DvalAA-14]MYS25274.1 GNAT family N-acetyltransferase [Streptomyces sp. SID4948]SCE53411.1 Acetyltransferase (GNAT) family protein [Streptomyces sp. DvalAA-14]